jgi:uncharacterized membrane protein YfcA
MAPGLLVTIVFIAAALQTASGFGFALLVMPLLTLILGVRTAAPLVALAGLTLYAINLYRYRRAINLREVARLALAAAFGVPVGIWLLGNLDQRWVEAFLGGLLVTYAVYGLWSPRLPALESSWWSLPAGFLAGCLGGAYNTPGPPVIVYGNLRRMPRDGFRSMLQALFLFSGSLVVIGHALAGNLTAPILRAYALTVPALLLGILVGSFLDRRLSGSQFRTLVTAMIGVLGLSLLL